MPIAASRQIVLALCLAIATPAFAAPKSEEAALTAHWHDPGKAAQFDNSFVAKTNPEQVASIITGLTGRCGDVDAITSSTRANHFTVRTKSCDVPVVMIRNIVGGITGLFIEPAVRRDVSLDSLLSQARTLSHQASYAIYQGRALIAAVGSAFKLVVPAALKTAV